MSAAEEVEAAARERAAALAAGDADRLTELLHEDFHWTSHLGDGFDRTEYVRRNTAGETVWRAQELNSVTVTVVGDTAVLRAEVADEVRLDDGGWATHRMPMTQVWVRVDGRWLCLAGHAGPRR